MSRLVTAFNCFAGLCVSLAREGHFSFFTIDTARSADPNLLLQILQILNSTDG